jgi:hypothetical protein
MTAKKQRTMSVVPFRLPPEIVERLDACAKRLQRDQPGFRVTRADALRSLLLKALDEDEKRSRRGKA